MEDTWLPEKCPLRSGLFSPTDDFMAPFPEAADTFRLFLLLIPVIALAVNVAVQILLVRAYRGAHFMRSMAGGFLAGFLSLAALSAFPVVRLGMCGELFVLCVLVNV